MANLTESPIYEPGIFQLEKSTPPLGGAPVIDNGVPSAGHANAQGLQLANRTGFLKAQVDSLDSRVDIIEEEIASGGGGVPLDTVSVTPIANGIPRADADGKIDEGWLSSDIVDLRGEFESYQTSTDSSIMELEVVQTQTNQVASQTNTDQRAMFRRKKILDLPMYGSQHTAIIAAYGYAYMYPQGIAVDVAADQILVNYGPSGGTNTWAWIYVYKLSTGAFLTAVTTEVGINESMVIRYENGTTYSETPFTGATRYLYASADYNIAFGGSSNVAKINITGIEAKAVRSSIASSVTFPYANTVQAFSFMAWTGQEWIVQRLTTSKNVRRRNLFERYNNDFSAYVGNFSTPFNFTGQITGTYYPTSPKAQGFACVNGKLYTAIGAPYSTLSGSPANNNPLLPGKMYGIATVGPDGTGLTSALCQADKFIAALQPSLSYTATQIEAEGMCGSVGKLYTLFITLGAATGLPETSGLCIFEELSSDPSAIDFSKNGSVNRGIFSELDTSVRVHNNPSRQLADPVIGTSLTSYAQICNMMTGLDISTYSLTGNGQTLTDMAGTAVSPTTNRLFKFTNLDGNIFILEVVGDAAYERFTINLSAGTQARSGWSTGIVGTAFPITSGYVATNGGSLGRTQSFRNANVSVPHYEFFNLESTLTAKQLVGSISTSGNATVFATSSDEKLKVDKGVIPVSESDEVVSQFIFRNFDWVTSGVADKGVFAQELYKIYPQAVSVGGWFKIEEDDPEGNEVPAEEEESNSYYKTWGVDYSKLITPIGRSVQGLLERVAKLEKLLTASAEKKD